MMSATPPGINLPMIRDVMFDRGFDSEHRSIGTVHQSIGATSCPGLKMPLMSLRIVVHAATKASEHPFFDGKVL